MVTMSLLGTVTTSTSFFLISLLAIGLFRMQTVIWWLEENKNIRRMFRFILIKYLPGYWVAVHQGVHFKLVLVVLEYQSIRDSAFWSFMHSQSHLDHWPELPVWIRGVFAPEGLLLLQDLRLLRPSLLPVLLELLNLLDDIGPPPIWKWQVETNNLLKNFLQPYNTQNHRV